MLTPSLISFLNNKVAEYDQPFFIKDDPVSVPHKFSDKRDIEIAGFFAALFSWGNRKTIINKSLELMGLMDNAPYDFCINHTDEDLKKLLLFKHRTFNPTDLLYFIDFFRMHYKMHESLEIAFTRSSDNSMESRLNAFYDYFFSLEDVPRRTRKHISSPQKKGTCKRLCMYLRWMVRQNSNVDFGIWKGIKPRELVVPLDVHVARVARSFGLITRKETDWKTALELTNNMKALDPEDPCKYDYALFALGVLEKF